MSIGSHQLADPSQLLAVIIDHFPGGLAVTDKDLRLVVCNQRMRDMLAFPDELFADGMPSLEDLFRFNASRGEYGDGDVQALVAERLARAREGRAHQFVRERPDGTVLEVRGMPLEGGGFVTTYTDVTEQHSAQRRLHHLSRHDVLTGLCNRLEFSDRLEDAIAEAAAGTASALMVLDLDDFKPVNDEHGHAVGDELLKSVADRIRRSVRPTDTVARLGGDEFGIVQRGCRDRRGMRVLQARLQRRLSVPFTINDTNLQVGCSIGAALAPEDGASAAELFDKADTALYATKRSRKSRHERWRQ